MNAQLYHAGIIAIPLLADPTTSVLLHPNYFVIENQYGSTTAVFPNLQTGQPEETICVNLNYKLVFREILPAKNGKSEEFIERLLQPTEMIQLPMEMLLLAKNPQAVLTNADIIDTVLGMFKFRGIFDELVMKIDRVQLQAIIDDIAAKLAPEPTPQPTPEA